MILVILDGKMSSTLDFRAGRHEALLAIARGEKILWELQLGFFKDLSFPLGHETEAKAMLLAIDHFIKTIWSEFHAYSIGLCLYRGDTQYEPQLFSDYLKYLTLSIPDTIPLYLHFEDTMTPFLEVARRTSRALFPRFEIRINGEPLPQQGTVGFLLPSKGDALFATLSPRPRILTEEYLSSEWDGLDTLYVDSASLSKEGRRKVQGFIAAGGEVMDLFTDRGFGS